MGNLDNLFDGLGTELIIFFLTAVVLGFGGYKIVSKWRLSQKAGRNSVQIQSGRDTHIQE
jgi:hypothetical protein